jgi:hypothetical protein
MDTVYYIPGQISPYSESLPAGRSGDRVPVAGDIFRTRQDRPWGPPSPVKWVSDLFPRIKAAGTRNLPHDPN